jgi:hypothetical protein
MKTFNQMNVLWTVSQSLFIMPCPHPKDALLEDADDYSVFLTPHYDAMSSGFLERPGDYPPNPSSLPSPAMRVCDSLVWQAALQPLSGSLRA